MNALVPPSFDEAEDTDAPLTPPAFDDAQDTDAPLRPPSFDDAEDIPAPAVPTSSATGDFIKRVASSATQGTMQIGRALMYVDEHILPSPLGQASRAVFGKADPWDLMRKEVVRFGTDVQEGAASELGVDPAREGTIPSKLAAATGSVIPIVASAGLAPVAAAAMMAEGQREDAEAHGAGELGQLGAFAAGGAVGVVSELTLGLPALLRSAKAVAGTAAKGAVRQVGEQVVKGALREGAQEGGEQFLGNVIAKGIYDPERGVLEGVPEAIALGAAVGGPLGGVVQTAATVDAQRANALSNGIEQDIATIAPAEAQPPLAPLTVTENEISTGPAPTTELLPTATDSVVTVPAPSTTLGTTPSGDKEFIRIPGAMKRLTQGLEREGSADVIGRTKNAVGQQLSQAIRKHVDTEQELFAKTSQPLTKALTGVPRFTQEKAFDEVETYFSAKENGRPLPKLTTTAQKLATAWEDIAEQSGLLAEQNDVQVFDPTTGAHRPMHRIGRAYVPRMFKPEVQRVLTDPQSNPELFRDLAQAMSEHRGISLDEAATELRGEAGRFQASDFMGNLERARTGQLPEIFYDYDLRRIASRYIPAFSERMAQIMAYGQRLGPRDAPTRPNLWDAARSESEDAYTQNYLREAEDQSANLHSRTGFGQIARKGQAIASGLLLSNPFTTIPRNVLSGVTSTAELLGAWRSAKTLREAATSAQAKMDAKEIGATRDQIAGFLHADELGQSWGDEAVRTFTDTLLTFSGYSGSEVFVRTHAALTAAQFAKDGVSAIQKNPASSRAKEALGLFQRMGVDPQAIVSEGADWKTGDKTREFIRTVIRDTQGGYRFDQVPLWANSSVGRYAYQLGRWGTQRARNIWKNGIKPLLGETVEWNGKKMVRYDAGPFLKMIGSTVLLGEAFAGIAALFFDRDRKDATLQEIREAWSDDEGKAVGLALERVVNDIVMAGTLGIWGQPVDFMKSYKDQSRLKNPAEPPALAWGKAAIDLFEDYVDQDQTVTKNDLLRFAGSVLPGAKQGFQVARNVLDEPLYEAQNDVSTLRASASRWARTAGLDVPKRAAMDFRKGPNSPKYEAIQEALLVGNADRAKTLASEFVAKQKDRGKAMTALRTSVKGKQPFRVGPFTNARLRSDFMAWAKTNLPKQDLEQVKRVQERYETSAKRAGLW